MAKLAHATTRDSSPGTDHMTTFAHIVPVDKRNGRTGVLRRSGLPRTYEKHGLTKVARMEHETWSGMRDRCFSKTYSRYSDYGGRGITICHRWLFSFAAFYEDMGPRPPGLTIDRVDNNGNYSCGKCEECVSNGWPANCRWATQKEQSDNRRRNRRAVVLMRDGKEMSVSEVARSLGITRGSVHFRIRLGWPMERVVSEAPSVSSALLKGRTCPPPTLVHFNGEIATTGELARRAGMAIGTVRKRIARGVAIADALRPVPSRDVLRQEALAALAAHGGNKTLAARSLGIDPVTIGRRLRSA